MKKLLSLTLALAIIICAIPLGTFTLTASAATSGTTGVCGWRLDGTVLTISGNGAMGDYVYYENRAPWFKTSITEVVIEDGVTSIGDCAFLDCTSLTSVTIGDSVTSIGESAFYYCKSLTSVTIPDSVTIIGNGAFEYCYNLTSVTIGDGVTIIGYSAFGACDSLTEIVVSKNNNRYSSQDGVVFNKDKTILIQYPIGKTNTSYIIPNSVTSIGGWAFGACESLTNITIPDSVTSIGYGAFSYCKSLTSITIPDSVTSIGDHAFCFCESLTSITIPDSVTSIGIWAFSGCVSLTSVTIGDSVTSIGEFAFRSCTGLTSITIPNSVTSIGEYAFYWCTSLTSVTIGDSVTSIGDYTFDHCESLKSITIPNSIISIGHYAFYDCESLREVYYTGTKQDRENIKIGDENWELYNATWYYNYGKTYPDVSQNAWYTDAVTYAVGAGIMSGYSNGKFGTSDSIQRQDFLVMLARLDGVDLNNYKYKSSFPDVARNSYYEAAVNWGAENGIVTGYKNGKFGVGDKVTREQLVTFLYRYAGYKGYDTSYSGNGENVVASQYKDYSRVSSFAKEPILWAIEKGVISGKTSTTIVPQGNAQRCEVAKIMYNIYLNDIFK